MQLEQLPINSRIRVTQHVYAPSRRDIQPCGHAEGRFEGQFIERTSPLKNAYAHSRSKEYPLRRIRLIKDDGERDILLIDQLTRIDILD